MWSCPFGGIAGISEHRHRDGKEEIVFAFVDGHLGVICNAETDDGFTITGTARSPPLPADLSTKAFTAIMLTMSDKGSGESVAVKTYADQSQGAVQTWTDEFDAGASVFGTAVFGTDKWSDRRMKTRKILLPAGTRGEGLQYEIVGAGRWLLRKAEALLRPISQRSK